MQKLKDAKLYRNELIEVQGKLVSRYNRCLEKLGFEPTKLENFTIDGIGWSPEIAEEKGNTHYLNNGDANPHGIIISPQQKGKPIYNPYHTFDRELLKLVFRTHEDKINDITRDSAICLDIDQGIDAFYEPLDLLRYSTVKVCFQIIDDLDKIREDQMKIIAKFNMGNNFIDEEIHSELLESARKYGDLRFRNVDLYEIEFQASSFYTKAFGGVYLLRDFISPIIIFEDKKWHAEAIKDTLHDVLIYHIDQPELVDKLQDHLIIECNLEEIVQTERYKRIKQYMFYKVLKEPRHPIKSILEDNVLFKSYLNRIELEALKKVNGVEIYLERLERSNQYKIEDMVDDTFYTALHRPHSSLPPNQQDLIWKLLVNLAPLDVLHLYWYDKENFFKAYREWDESFQDWVIELIRNNI